jgi:hypothetical protein
MFRLGRAAVNTLNKQPQTNNKEVVLQLGGWRWGQQNLTHKKKIGTYLGLGKRIRTRDLGCGMLEVCIEQAH